MNNTAPSRVFDLAPGPGYFSSRTPGTLTGERLLQIGK